MDINQAIEISFPQLEALLASSPDRVIVFDTNGRIRFANGAARRASGSSQEMIGQALEARLQQVVQRGEEIRAEEWLPGEDGMPSHLETILSPVFGPDGNPVAVLNISRDLTPQQASAKELQRSEALYRQLIEQAADGIFQGAPDGSIIAVNPAACGICGYSAAELLGKNLAMLFSAEELARVPFRYDLLNEGKTVVSERFVTRRDGSTVPVEMKTRKMENGTYLSNFRDVSARMEAERILKQNEAILNSIIDANPYSILLVDTKGHHVRHNQAFLDLFGLAPPPEYSVFDDPLLQAAHITETLKECLRGKRVTFLDNWYDVHEILPEVPTRRRCLRSTVFPLREEGREIQALVIMHEDITDWKLAEEALRKQEEQYRNLFFTMAQGVVYQDARGRVISSNPAAEEILGLSLEQMMGLTSMDPRWGCIHEDGTPFPGEEHPAMVALRSGEPVHGVVMGIYHPKEVRHRWAVVNATPEFLPGQEKPWRVFATLTDITEHKTVQDAHRATALRLQGVLNNSQAVIFQVDAEGRFLLSEGRDLALLGLRPGQVVGLSALEMYRDSPSTIAALKLALAGGSCRTALDVRGLVFDTNLSPVFDSEGRLESVIGVSTNITERVKVERALRESEQKFRELLENLGEGFAVVDPDETFTFVNPAAEGIFGVGRGQLLGRNLHEFLDPVNSQKILASKNAHRRFGRRTSYELTIRRPNQELRQILVNVAPLMDPQGKHLGANGIFQDITERRQAEDALRQSQKLESLGVLAGGIAHDFNNLLTAILGNLNLAQTVISEESAALPYLENVEKSVLRAADLTKQMLAYSGKGRFVVKLHDLNQVVKEMTTLVKVSIPKKIALRFLLSPTPLPIEADAAQLHQVVMNLVTNASEAIGEMDGAITLATRVETLELGQVPSADPGQTLAPGPYAILEVSDSGSGMDAEVLARIFDPFFSTKASGRGLGLSAMLGILRGHKAGIQIQSQVNQGSTFTICFPLAQAAHEEPGAPDPRSNIRFSGVVLAVDDEPTVLEFTGQALNKLGFKAVLARDGQEAMEHFTATPDRFDLVLLDLTMPRMDGRETLQRLRRLRPELPVILSSGYSDQESLKELASDPFLLFLAKPYRIAQLKQTLQDLLHSGRPGTR